LICRRYRLDPLVVSIFALKEEKKIPLDQDIIAWVFFFHGVWKFWLNFFFPLFFDDT
jgi:hypothetical protein